MRHKLDIMEVKCLWRMYGAMRMDIWRNEKVRHRVGVRGKMIESKQEGLEVVQTCGAYELEAVD